MNKTSEEMKKYIPPYAKAFAANMKKTYPEGYMGKKFFYDDEGNGIIEVSIILENGKEWKPKGIWKGGKSYMENGSKEITNTRKQMDDAERKIEERRKDSVFNEIEKVVLQIATEYKYDFEKAYGIEAKYRNPNTKKAVCDGYANAVVDAFKNHHSVAKVEKWYSNTGKHAWNVIALKDGRKIYCDATWYQGNSIDNEGYVVETINKNPVNLTFDIEEFNTLGKAIDGNTGEILKVHFAWEDASIENYSSNAKKRTPPRLR
jgi:hypothetical protein